MTNRRNERYDGGTVLPLSLNTADHDTYGPMLDWSHRDRITFSSQRQGARDMDVYVIRYRLSPRD